MDRGRDNSPIKILPPTPLEEKLSYIDHENKRLHLSRSNEVSWTSFSLRWPYQTTLAIISICLLVSIEALRRLSDRLQGFGRYSATIEIPTSIFIAYNFVPAILGTIYSILWSLIDADAKRLEPYFQMRSPLCSATNLHLDYVFRSAFSTPLRALKRGHWLLSIISFTYLIIALVFLPSQGALFSIETTHVVSKSESFLVQSKDFRSHSVVKSDLMTQYKALQSQGTNKTLPWTTSKYAIDSFQPLNGVSTKNVTWAVESNLYYLEPNCQRLVSKNSRVTFPPARGRLSKRGEPLYMISKLLIEANFTLPSDPVCLLTLTIIIDINPRTLGNFSSLYSYFVSPGAHNYHGSNGIDAVAVLVKHNGKIQLNNEESKCPGSGHLAGILQMEYKNTKPFRNPQSRYINKQDVEPHMSLLACSMPLYKDNGLVSINAQTGDVLSVEPSNNAKVLNPSGFNTAYLQYVIEYGLDRSIVRDVPRIVSNKTLVQPANSSITDLTNPGMWAIVHGDSLSSVTLTRINESGPQNGLLNHLFYDFSFVNAIQESLQGISAIALNSLPTDPEGARQVEGISSMETVTVVINKAFAIISETMLAWAAAVLVASSCLYSRRKSVVRCDPDSLSAQCGLLADGFINVSHLANLSSSSEKQYSEYLENQAAEWHLRYEENSSTISLARVKVPKCGSDGTEQSTRRPTRDSLPIFITLKGISIILFTLLIMFVLLLFAVIWTRVIGGVEFALPLSSFKAQLLWSFAPTLIATYLETLWVSIHRDLSALEPWVRLQKNLRTASDTLSLRYSSRPPFIVLWLAFRRRHLLVLLVSLVCVTTSILNIAMAGLFIQSFSNDVKSVQMMSLPTTLLLESLPEELRGYNLQNLESALSIVYANYAESMDLPPWTTKDFFAFPAVMNETQPLNPDSLRHAELRSTTQTYGARLNCTELSQEKLVYRHLSNGEKLVDQRVSRALANLTTSMTSNGSSVECTSQVYIAKNGIQSITAGSINRAEFRNRAKGSRPKIDCSSLILLQSYDVTSSKRTFYSCEAEIARQNRTITHTAEGLIKSSLDSDEIVTAWKDLEYRERFLFGYFCFSLQKIASTSARLTNYTLYDWFGLTIAKLQAADQGINAAEAAEKVFPHLFAAYLSINWRFFMEERSNSSQPNLIDPKGTIVTRESRIVPSIPAFVVAITLLAFYIVCFIITVIYRRKRFSGPRIPKSIGDLIPWVIHSQMLDDFAGLHYMSSSERDEVLTKLDRRYGFGNFPGSDGKFRVGVEYSDLILEDDNLSATSM